MRPAARRGFSAHKDGVNCGECLAAQEVLEFRRAEGLARHAADPAELTARLGDGAG